MNSCALIIPICRHILPNGRRCQQPAVRRRACCRHHLDAQARLRNWPAPVAAPSSSASASPKPLATLPGTRSSSTAFSLPSASTQTPP